MKLFYFILFYLIFINFIVGQSFSFHGGYGLGRHWGTNFSVKADIVKKPKWMYSVCYSLVKQVDNRAHPRAFVGFHIVNQRDKTFKDFPELDRGVAIQSADRDPRPSILSNRFSLLTGYKSLDTKGFLCHIYFGPHFLMDRTILDNVFQEFTTIIENPGEQEKILPYQDWQIYRSWDIGLTSRLEIEYKLFQNVSVGMSSQIAFDILQEGISLVGGVGVTFHFSDIKK